MMWNFFLVRDFYEFVKRKSWVIPVVHGSIDFMNFEEAGNKFTLLLIARRSRHFAGTRYLRRGIN
jgi:phosphatidylinositol 3,5-bisphosphate 5-phosphatase